MSLLHFFLKDQVISKDIELSDNNSFALNLNKEDFHHAKVLRLKPGEHIGVIDAENIYYECEIKTFDDKLIVNNCLKDNSHNKDNLRIWLCPGLSKSNKMDDVIRACTEIGIFGFMPLNFERTVIKLDNKKEVKRIERWKKIAKSAAMQSGQYKIPIVEEIYNVKEISNKLKSFDCIFICWECADNKQIIKDVCNNLKNTNKDLDIAIIVGPEGGISNKEIDILQACNKNSHIVCISDSILRTETACITAASIIKYNLTC